MENYKLINDWVDKKAFHRIESSLWLDEFNKSFAFKKGLHVLGFTANHLERKCDNSELVAILEMVNQFAQKMTEFHNSRMHEADVEILRLRNAAGRGSCETA